MDTPIFIVGANRSGTTLLRLILNAHSRIAIPEELNYFHSNVAGTPISEWDDVDAVSGFGDFFVRTRSGKLAEWGLEVQSLRDRLAEEEPYTLREPYAMILQTWADLHGKARWGEKTPGNLFYADVLIEMFPEARFLHLVRDPRGGVASMQGVGFFSDDIVFNALARRKSMTKGRSILEKHVPPEQRMTLRYEDLVHDPERTVREICDFIGEAYEPGMLQYHESAEQYMKEEAASGFNATATQPISPKIAEKWRNRLSQREVTVVEYVCQSDMQEFGYTPEGLSLNWTDWLEAFIKQGYWYWQCWRNRHIRHYMVVYPLFARFRTRLGLL